MVVGHFGSLKWPQLQYTLGSDGQITNQIKSIKEKSRFKKLNLFTNE